MHAFAGDDRGAHLAALLERVATLSGRDLQRVGLSATVGNLATIGEWLQGSSRRPREVVHPPGAPARRALHVLAQQVFGLVLQERGLPRRRLLVGRLLDVEGTEDFVRGLGG